MEQTENSVADRADPARRPYGPLTTRYVVTQAINSIERGATGTALSLLNRLLAGLPPETEQIGEVTQ